MMIECLKCGWQGELGELYCSDEDGYSNKPTDQLDFNICPHCDSVNDFEDIGDEE